MTQMENNNHLDLKVGWECNNNCIHCVVSDKSSRTAKQKFTLDEIKSYLDQNNDCGKITITGGEPTIRPDFIEIVKYIKETISNVQVDLQTNGRLFSNYEFAVEAMKYIDYAVIALHSSDEAIHDHITGKPGSWKQTIEGIKNLVKNNPLQLQTITVISRLNMHTLCDTFDLLSELGSMSSILTFPHANGSAWQNFNIVVPKYSEIRKQIDYIITTHPTAITASIPPCYLLKNEDRIAMSLMEYKRMENMDKDLCIELSAPDRTENFFDMVEEEFLKSPECAKCVFDDQCMGVWKEYVWKYKNELDLIPVILED